mmetsp:Transcript_5335/g.12115  ORF Transcript_5335/g.12115 Transcript_5335/m.12115 type:complete len:114 (-) Transcript_5335:209-550(-)
MCRIALCEHYAYSSDCLCVGHETARKETAEKEKLDELALASAKRACSERGRELAAEVILADAHEVHIQQSAQQSAAEVISSAAEQEAHSQPCAHESKINQFLAKRKIYLPGAT